MLVAATVTSGCHTADVASASGSGSNTSLANGALGNRHGYAGLSPNVLTFCTFLSCSRTRLMLSEQYYSTFEHSFGVWLHNLHLCIRYHTAILLRHPGWPAGEPKGLIQQERADLSSRLTKVDAGKLTATGCTAEPGNMHQRRGADCSPSALLQRLLPKLSPLHCCQAR